MHSNQSSLLWSKFLLPVRRLRLHILLTHPYRHDISLILPCSFFLSAITSFWSSHYGYRRETPFGGRSSECVPCECNGHSDTCDAESVRKILVIRLIMLGLACFYFSSQVSQAAIEQILRKLSWWLRISCTLHSVVTQPGRFL